MKEYSKDNAQNQQVNESSAEYAAYQAVDYIRLREHMAMSDLEKYRLFRKMMRIGKMLSSAKVTHKS